jgi:hypothetical protein
MPWEGFVVIMYMIKLHVGYCPSLVRGRSGTYPPGPALPPCNKPTTANCRACVQGGQFYVYTCVGCCQPLPTVANEALALCRNPCSSAFAQGLFRLLRARLHCRFFAHQVVLSVAWAVVAAPGIGRFQLLSPALQLLFHSSTFQVQTLTSCPQNATPSNTRAASGRSPHSHVLCWGAQDGEQLTGAHA